MIVSNTAEWPICSSNTSGKKLITAAAFRMELQGQEAGDKVC